MSFISNFKENKKYKDKYNTEHIQVLTLEAEQKRQEIIIDEIKESVASVRKIWMDANNEKELKIVELVEEINKLKKELKKTKEAKEVMKSKNKKVISDEKN